MVRHGGARLGFSREILAARRRDRGCFPSRSKRRRGNRWNARGRRASAQWITLVSSVRISQMPSIAPAYAAQRDR
jgi:hypothetical protein